MARSSVVRARPSEGHKVRWKAVDEIDIAVGKAVRFFRIRAGMSQATRASELGVTFQQIQKYEKGVNRNGSGRFLKIARLFNRPITARYPMSGNDGAVDFNEIITLTDRPQPMCMLKIDARTARQVQPHLRADQHLTGLRGSAVTVTWLNIMGKR